MGDLPFQGRRRHCDYACGLVNSQEAGNAIRQFGNSAIRQFGGPLVPRCNGFIRLGLMLVALTACQRDAVSPEVERATLAVAARNAAEKGSYERGFEDDLLRIESGVPGFGGMEVDPISGQVSIYLTDVQMANAAYETIRSESRGRSFAPSLRSALQRGSGMNVRLGKFAFSELVAMQRVVSSRVNVEGLNGIDADESRNRLRLLVESSSIIGRVRHAVMGIGIPEDALFFEVSPAMRLSSTTTLQSYRRPAIGGFQIQNENGNSCSLGFNVLMQYYGVRGFLTASHCSDPDLGAGRVGDTIYQPVKGAGNAIGVVEINPAWSRQDTECGIYGRCTTADVMFVRALDQSTSSTPAHIVATYMWQQNFNNNTPGSLQTTVTNGEVPHFANFDVFYSPFVNMKVYKAGRTTGVTSGLVSGTCMDVVIFNQDNIGAKLLCVEQVSGAKSDDGDSGAPVFYPAVAPDPAYAVGILSSTLTSSFLFTRWSAIHGTLARYFSPQNPNGSPTQDMPASIQGDLTTWQGAQQTWAANVSGGTEPYVYSWSGWDGSAAGTDESITSSPGAAGYLALTVWDADGRHSTTMIHVTWCGEYAC